MVVKQLIDASFENHFRCLSEKSSFIFSYLPNGVENMYVEIFDEVRQSSCWQHNRPMHVQHQSSSKFLSKIHYVDIYSNLSRHLNDITFYLMFDLNMLIDLHTLLWLVYGKATPTGWNNNYALLRRSEGILLCTASVHQWVRPSVRP